MPLVSPARLLLLLCLVVFAAGAHAQARTFATPPDTGRGAWFLDMLEALSDVDGLSDPDKVGAILGVRFNKTVATKSPQYSESFAKKFERDEYVPTAKTWFVASPSAHALMLKYSQLKLQGVKPQDRYIGSTRFKDEVSTYVVFHGIDKLVCVTVSEVEKRFAGLYHMEASDAAAESYLYRAPIREDAGSDITFMAPRGRCMTDVTVEESSSYGKHHRRAKAKFNACVLVVEKWWCNEYPRAELAAHFSEVVHQRCAGLDELYDKEPSNDVMPPPDDLYSQLPVSCPDRHR